MVGNRGIRVRFQGGLLLTRKRQKKKFIAMRAVATSVNGKDARQRRTPADAITTILTWASELTPSEFDEALLTKFRGNLKFLGEIYASHVEPFINMVEETPALLNKAGEIREFLGDLERGGVVPAGVNLESLFTLTTERAMMRHQAATAAAPSDAFDDRDHRRAFPKLVKMYAHLYETTIAEKLAPVARLIRREPALRNKAKILEAIACYRGGKHIGLLRSFCPAVRNAIQHEDWLVDNKLPLITFMDSGKPVVTFALPGFKALCMDLLQWNLAFDYALWKRKEPFLRMLAKKMEKLQAFLDKSDYRLVRSRGGSSLAELAERVPDDTKDG